MLAILTWGHRLGPLLHWLRKAAHASSIQQRSSDFSTRSCCGQLRKFPSDAISVTRIISAAVCTTAALGTASTSRQLWPTRWEVWSVGSSGLRWKLRRYSSNDGECDWWRLMWKGVQCNHYQSILINKDLLWNTVPHQSSNKLLGLNLKLA